MIFCSNCGSKVVEGCVQCSQCGEMLASTSVNNVDKGAFTGLLILVTSFFLMPLKTLKITRQQLRELSERGDPGIRDTEVPHLTWLGIAGHFVASLAIILLIIAGIVKGLLSLQHMEYSYRYFNYSTKDALWGLLVNSIGGVFAAIAANWVIMIWLELMLLLVNIANNIKKLSDKG